MPKRHNVELKEKAILFYEEEKLSTKQIAEILNIPYKTVSRWINNFKREQLKSLQIDHIYTQSEITHIIKINTFLEKENAELRKIVRKLQGILKILGDTI